MRIMIALVAVAAIGVAPGAAQQYDATSQSPLVLLAAPADPIAYHAARTRAKALVAASNWTEAEPLAEQLVKEYPRDGENWLMLARAKANLRKPAEAATAYMAVSALMGGEVPWLATINAAIQYWQVRDTATTLATLRTAIFRDRSLFRSRIYDWSQFAGLRTNKEFLELAGRVDTAGWSRNEGWVRDITYLHDEMKRVNPEYHDEPFPAEFTRRYEALKADVPRLSDEEIYVGLGRMIAPLRQGHIGFFAPSRDRYLPFRPYAFPDGVYIIEADSAYRGLVGSKVVRVGELGSDEVVRRLAEARSVDGDMGHVWQVSDMTSAWYLKGIGAIGSTESVRLVVQVPGGAEKTITVPTLPAPRAGRQDKMIAPTSGPVPMYLSKLDQTHWEVAVPEHRAVYIQLNNISNDTDETMEQFGVRMRTVLATVSPDHVILDLRHNNGGSTAMYPEFLRTMIGFTVQPGKQLYVLIGRRTFSATANLITDLERLANPLFVGEASSECCNLFGDPAQLTLPYSGVQAEVTAIKWNLSWNAFDGRREMSPEVPVVLTARDYFAGRDPVMETVFRLISTKD